MMKTARLNPGHHGRRSYATTTVPFTTDRGAPVNRRSRAHHQPFPRSPPVASRPSQPQPVPEAARAIMSDLNLRTRAGTRCVLMYSRVVAVR